jgi:hypothetical protein
MGACTFCFLYSANAGVLVLGKLYQVSIMDILMTLGMGRLMASLVQQFNE